MSSTRIVSHLVLPCVDELLSVAEMRVLQNHFRDWTDTPSDSLESFSRYFLYFAVAARMHAGRA